MIRNAGTKAVALEPNARYEPIRAVTFIARLLTKALFGGRPDEVVFWPWSMLIIPAATFRRRRRSNSTNLLLSTPPPGAVIALEFI